MFAAAPNPGLTRNTSHKVVLPFYVYASVSFLVATVLLLFSSSAFLQHYFHPQTLAVTHLMALGWGTMMILGASHQLVPVLIEGKLFSNALAVISFAAAGIGIPLLVYAFYMFSFGWQAQWGAILINAALLIYLVNIGASMAKSKSENIHAVFVFTATLWLFITTIVGLFLVYNFSYNLLSFDSLYYLPLHAHMGIAGWFLLMVTGVGSRLIPMFLISKYNNIRLLWWIYGLINGALLFFVVNFLVIKIESLYFFPIATIFIALLLFVNFCYNAYNDRLRKKVDGPLTISLLSVGMMAIPIIFLLIIMMLLLFSLGNTELIMAYGFCIFFGWITAIIFGMTFKTLPFILWNKKYHTRAGSGKTPNPKDLFSEQIFKSMVGFYIAGFVLFIIAVLVGLLWLIQLAASCLVVAALLYNTNVFKLLLHKPGES